MEGIGVASLSPYKAVDNSNSNDDTQSNNNNESLLFYDTCW